MVYRRQEGGAAEAVTAGRGEEGRGGGAEKSGGADEKRGTVHVIPDVMLDDAAEGRKGTPSAEEWAWRACVRGTGATVLALHRCRGQGASGEGGEERHRVWRREDPNLQQNSGGLW
eukprot:TRINITY_DN3116_c0_g1_i2.p2 TRINITY_DN3116_c0_g1~~TRINITY_DN3116_c0_g1_i2.p2  ORF type:complete len:116 (+),score=4.58 TRINITY_DN3116_c0_g1_i2:724-1071(+)